MGKVSKRNQKPQKKFVKKQTNLPKSRKDIRKEKRNNKKIHRKEYYEKNNHKVIGQYVKFPNDDVDSPDEEITDIKKIDKKQNFQNNRLMKDTNAEKRKEKKLKHGMKEHRIDQLLKANEEEDKIIKKFEKKLNFKKSGAIPKSFKEDGLSYLLEVCDSNTISAAVATEKHLIDNESGSDFEEDFALATGQTKKIAEKSNKNKIGNNSGDFESDSCDENNVEDSDMDKEIEEQDNGECSDLNVQSDDDDLDELMEQSSSDEELVTKSKSKKKSISKSLPENFVSAEDSEEEIDESFCNGELTDEELEMLYTGETSFPDGVYRPDNLTPICEETESDINLYKSGIDVPMKKNESVNEISMCDSEESCMDDSSEENCMDHSSEENCMDDSSENSFIIPSDNSECEVNISSCDESEGENKQIIVNGKVINTYGREIAPKVDEDIVRCPALDKILANISDSEAELDKRHHSNEQFKSAGPSNSAKIKTDKKRKKHTDDEIDTNSSKKRKSLIEPNLSENCMKSIESKQNRKKPEPENYVSSDDSFSQFDDDQQSDDNNDEHSEKPEEDVWEDIYGRKRDKEGKIIDNQNNKYVPPHLRKSENDTESAEMQQLKRQIKSLLNKVAGSNMYWISSQLESVYNSHSRHSVNSSFCTLWMNAVIQQVSVSDRLAIEHSVLVASLHANVGSEIGAFFLQMIFKKFDELLKSEQKLENKELDNLILGISQLYNFKVFHSSLLYEVLDKFIENLSEKSIDCILVVLRNVGGVLRKEDPAALKIFIQNAQEKSASLKNSSSGSRVSFLLDVLLAIKNNNLNKIPNYDPSYSEEMKKTIKSILRRGNTVVPLNIKLEDLLNSDKHGKWWIVGSAWEQNSNIEKSNKNKKGNNLQQSHLLKLADKQRINTDLRRNIFCVIMSAEDYVDAFEKLQHLGLKQQQEREIINILMICCLQEKEYNPYYSVLAQKFCDYDRKFQMSIQYNVWDKLKDLDSCSMFQISNLAQFLIHLFIEKGLPISILKVVQFAELSKPTLRLMRQILLGVLLHKNLQKVLEVFQRVAVSPKLHLFRESLRLFISHFLLKSSNAKENSLSDENATLLKERAESVDRILQSDSKLKF